MKKLKLYEQEWLNRLDELIVDNLDNASFTINQLAKDLYLSSASLNRKVNHICDCSPGEYVRKKRLETMANLG